MTDKSIKNLNSTDYSEYLTDIINSKCIKQDTHSFCNNSCIEIRTLVFPVEWQVCLITSILVSNGAFRIKDLPLENYKLHTQKGSAKKEKICKFVTAHTTNQTDILFLNTRF